MRATPSPIRRFYGIVAVGLSILGSMVLLAADDDGEPRERVILMKSGRVLTGLATRNPGGWLVEQGNGRVQVPGDQVAFVARSLVDAYRQQRDSVIEPTPATHLALAQWCLSFRLHDEARDELRKCLKLDPDHSAARKLLRRIDDMLEPVTQKKATPAAQRTSDGFLVPDIESLGGLSNDAAVSFTQRIQPLLMNKCGSASCHGSTAPSETTDRFHLFPVRNGSSSHRMYTERNLAEVLRFIDVSDPALSPLAMMPQGSHAGTAGIFHGTNGNVQLKMLRTWIKTVANEKRIEADELESRPTIANKRRRPSVHVDTNPPGRLPVDDGDFVVGTDSPVEAKSKVMTASYVDETSVPSKTSRESHAANPPGSNEAPKPTLKPQDKPVDDPFDPDVFNRQFHNPRR